MDVRKRLDGTSRAAYKVGMDTTTLPLEEAMDAGEAQPVLDAASCYRAVSARDSRFDGVFFTAVKTTGIYCRPVCSAKTPAATSCTFYPSAAAAEAAGFRPCLRCRPELAPFALQQNLAYAVWQKICAGALNQGSLEDLSVRVGLSSRQLRRLLQQYFGVAPLELAQTQRLLLAKQLLTETDLSMTEIAYAAGFGSLRRFNALFAERYKMPPGALRKNRHSLSSPASIKLRLAYRPPLAWEKLLSYLAGRALHGVEQICLSPRPLYRRCVRLGECEGWLEISQPGNAAEQSFLQIELSSSLLPVLQNLLSRVREQFDLDANPAVIEQHLQQDSGLRHFLQPGLRVPGGFDRFELAIRAILGQQVSVAAATTLAKRLIQRFGSKADSPWPELDAHFPQAEVLAAATIDELAGIGLPGKRAQTLQIFSREFAAGALEPAPGSSLSEVLARLQELPGIGEWSANYIALRALRFPDAFPAGDLGLQKIYGLHCGGERLSSKQLLQQAQNWAPWRGYAAMAMWQYSPASSNPAQPGTKEQGEPT